MKQKKKSRKGVTRSVMYCPYCGSRTELRSADGIYHDNRDNTMLYVRTIPDAILMSESFQAPPSQWDPWQMAICEQCARRLTGISISFT